MNTGPPSPDPERTDGAAEGWAVLSTLIGGLAVWGGVGFGLDRLVDVRFLLPVGLLVGVTAAIYMVYVRAGR